MLVIDLGANVDCTVRHLCEFAEMGMVYSERVFGVQNPRIGLLNIGEEQAKGNEIAIQSIKLENEGWERDLEVKEPTESSFTEPAS